MTIPNDLQSLSKEDLLALLNSARQELVVAKNERKAYKIQAAKFEKKAASLERKSNKYQQKCKELTDTNKHLEHQLQVSRTLTREHIELMAEMTREANCRIVDADEVLAWSINQQLQFVFEESREWVQNAITWRSQSFATGNDVKNEKVNTGNSSNTQDKQKSKDEPELTEEQQLAKLQNETLKQATVTAKRAVTTVKNLVTKQVKQLPKSVIALCPDAIKAIYDAKTPELDDIKPKKSPGRQKKGLVPTRVTKKENVPTVCPVCGTDFDEDLFGEYSKELGTLQKDLSTWTEYINVVCALRFCPKCRRIHAFFDKDSDLPIKPNRQFGQKLFLEACDNIFMGHPINHLAGIVNAELKYGHSTFNNNFIDGAEIYIKPIFEHIMGIAQNAEYLLADGTRFPCLETQGRGCCQLKKKDDEAPDGNSTESDEPSFSNYILSFCNVPMADVKFSCYDFLRTRSATSIEKILTDDFKFKTLICDAFGGYDTIVKKRDSLMQNCLVHLRRYFVNDVRPDDYANELLKLPEEEFQQFVTNALKEGNDRLMLFTVLVAISKIYALEGSVDLKAKDAKEQLLKVREFERELMNSLDEIMESLCSRHLAFSDDGKKVTKKKGDPYSRSCYYWYQRRDHFRVFLDDPMVPPDTNMVEQCIRPLTVLRKNSNFMCTEKGIKALCMVYTVWATLKKNGIDNPAEFLKPYCRELFTHCVEENYTHYLLDDHDLDPKKLRNKINTWNMGPLSKGFDFQKYFSLIFK